MRIGMRRSKYCSICGSELKPDEIDICKNCQASMIHNDMV